MTQNEFIMIIKSEEFDDFWIKREAKRIRAEDVKTEEVVQIGRASCRERV